MRRIIYADEDEFERASFGRTLVLIAGGHGIEATVTTVKNGRELVEAVRSGNYDLCFTERATSGMRGSGAIGYSAIKQIREDGNTIPIYFLTGALMGIDEEVSGSGATGYIDKLKTSKFEEINRAIQRYLGGN